MSELDLLQDSLEEYIDKWGVDIDKYKENVAKAIDVETAHNYNQLIVQLNAMKYVAQWIINSINGGLDKVHNTNICNIILREESDYE